jgi:hypothetical protein
MDLQGLTSSICKAMSEPWNQPERSQSCTSMLYPQPYYTLNHALSNATTWYVITGLFLKRPIQILTYVYICMKKLSGRQSTSPRQHVAFHIVSFII